MCNYLSKRGATYYFRRVIPLDLRQQFGAAEWVYSLRTKDRDIGKRLAQAEGVRTNALMDDARTLSSASIARPSSNTSSKASPEQEAHDRARFDHEQAQAEQERQDEREQEGRRDAREEYRQLWQERMLLTTAELTPQEAAVKEMLSDREFNLSLAKDHISSLKHLLATANAAPIPQLALTVTARRQQAIYLADLVDRWAAERKVTSKTKDATAAAIRLFERFLLPAPIADLTRRNVLDFKDWLLTTGHTAANAKMKLARLSGLFSYALDNDLVLSNPAKGVTIVDHRPARSKRAVYSRESFDPVPENVSGLNERNLAESKLL